MPMEPDADDADGKSLTDLVEQPAKVMRIGTMIKQLLEEVRAAPLDDASRGKLAEIHKTSIRELEDGLAPELRDELERLTLPFTEDSVPSDAELRIAQAQLVGWLEGLFHGIQTALFAQQMAARQQLEQMRQGALPPGMSAPGHARAGFARDRAVPVAAAWVAAPHIETRNAWVEFPIFDAKARSLKKAFLGKAGGTIGRNESNVVVIEALRDITMSLEHRRPGRSGRPQRCGQVDTAAPAVGHLRTHPRCRDGDRSRGADIRPRRRHGPRDIGLREHHHPRPVPGSDPQADGGQGGRDRRVHRARRLPLDAAAHLLHRHEGAAGDGRGHQHRPRDPSARRGHRCRRRRIPQEGADAAAGSRRTLRAFSSSPVIPTSSWPGCARPRCGSTTAPSR